MGCASFGDYLDYLEVHPMEFEELFDTLLINVTEFFRDPPAWEYLQTHALPAALADKPPGSPIRVWSAGCATGQEACTTAMGGPLSPSALARLFERIIDEARRLERESAGRHDERESDVLGGMGSRGGLVP